MSSEPQPEPPLPRPPNRPRPTQPAPEPPQQPPDQAPPDDQATPGTPPKGRLLLLRMEDDGTAAILLNEYRREIRVPALGLPAYTRPGDLLTTDLKLYSRASARARTRQQNQPAQAPPPPAPAQPKIPFQPPETDVPFDALPGQGPEYRATHPRLPEWGGSTLDIPPPLLPPDTDMPPYPAVEPPPRIWDRKSDTAFPMWPKNQPPTPHSPPEPETPQELGHFYEKWEPWHKDYWERYHQRRRDVHNPQEQSLQEQPAVHHQTYQEWLEAKQRKASRDQLQREVRARELERIQDQIRALQEHAKRNAAETDTLRDQGFPNSSRSQQNNGGP